MSKSEFKPITVDSLQKAIHDRALARLAQDFAAIEKAIGANPILSMLRIKGVGPNNDEVSLIDRWNGKSFFTLNNGGLVRGPFLSDHTDFESVRAELLNMYIDQETEELLRKVSAIEEYFNSNDAE